MTEMRALIFELRPESLEQEGLVGALKKQVAAVQARYRLVVNASFCPEPSVTLSIKEALYRVAQEERPDLVDRFGVEVMPTLVVVEGKVVRAKLERPRGCREIEAFLAPWLN